jgi:hypothetical protein
MTRETFEICSNPLQRESEEGEREKKKMGRLIYEISTLSDTMLRVWEPPVQGERGREDERDSADFRVGYKYTVVVNRVIGM